jgi:two-component system, OmpR family, response regulator MprA
MIPAKSHSSRVPQRPIEREACSRTRAGVNFCVQRLAAAFISAVWHAGCMHILVVDDDQAVRDSLKRSLEYNGYEVSGAEDGVQALARLAAVRPDAVIMDVMMPRLDGLETTRMLRAAGNDVPILVLTARDAVGDRVDGLDAGGDDYMAKPFALDELLARLRALVRRAGTVADSTDPSAQNLSFSDLVLNTQTREVLRGTRPINLTRTEFALLEAFMSHPRRVLERSWLLNEVWGFDFPTTANSLEVYIGYLRRKTEAADESRLIHTVRGVGYVLRETPP